MPGRFARPILLLWIGVMLTACSPLAVASLLPAASGPLVTVTTRGGECPEGACGSRVLIERNGNVHQSAPTEGTLGTVPAAALSALDTAIKVTAFDAIRSRPFTGECPVNFDGQEVVYEFGAPGGVERIASCETEIDMSHPLFTALSDALQAAAKMPTS